MRKLDFFMNDQALPPDIVSLRLMMQISDVRQDHLCCGHYKDTPGSAEDSADHSSVDPERLLSSRVLYFGNQKLSEMRVARLVRKLT